MNPGARLAAFALVLALAVAGGAALGGAIGPIDTSTGPHPSADHDTEPAHGTDDAPHDP